MKAIFIFISILLLAFCLVTGCGNDLISTNPDIYPAKTAGKLTRIEFDKHIYIIRDGGTYKGGICHDPDCKYCKAKVELEKR